MEGHGPSSSTSKTKMERKIIERNRRNYTKNLYSQLYSLLPRDGPKEDLTVPDQIDEAIKYIKSMEKKLEKYREEKETLLCGKRPHSSGATSETTRSYKLTNVEVHDMGSNVFVVLINGMEEHASLYGIIRLLCDEGFEVVNANFSSNGNSVLQVVLDKVGSSTSWTKTTEISERLKELIYRYSHGEAESRLDLWDFEIEPDILASDVLDLMPTG